MKTIKITKIQNIVIALIIASTLLISLTGCITINTQPDNNAANNQQGNQQNNQPNNQQNNQNSNNGSPEAEKRAKDVALADAGFQENQVNMTKCHLDYDDGVQKYEIEFVNGTKKYEYDVRADNFTIIKKEIDSIYD